MTMVTKFLMNIGAGCSLFAKCQQPFQKKLEIVLRRAITQLKRLSNNFAVTKIAVTMSSSSVHVEASKEGQREGAKKSGKNVFISQEINSPALFHGFVLISSAAFVCPDNNTTALALN